MQRFTQRDKETLEAIERHYEKHGVSPTFRDLCDALRIRSTSTVSLRVRRLEAHGHITCGAHGQPRTIRLTAHIDEVSHLRAMVKVLSRMATGTLPPHLYEEDFVKELFEVGSCPPVALHIAEKLVARGEGGKW